MLHWGVTAPTANWLGSFLICSSAKSIAFQDKFNQHKLFCIKCIKKAHMTFINVSSGQSIFHWICDHKHLVSGNCSCSWAELRYMVSSGVQMMGRGEDTKGDGICFNSFMVGLHLVGYICPDNLWSPQVPHRHEDVRIRTQVHILSCPVVGKTFQTYLSF